MIGPGARSRGKNYGGTWLDENSFQAQPSIDADSWEVKEWRAIWDQAITDGLLQSGPVGLLEKFINQTPTTSADQRQFDHFLSFVDYLPAFGDDISEAQQDSIRLGVERINSGDATNLDLLAYADEVYDSLFASLSFEQRTQ